MANKKGALELSIGTIVIIVLAMSMLILGLVLIRSIFAGAKYNVETMNDKVRDEIGKLFTEERKTVIYLANQKADIRSGEDWGIAWAVKNLKTGTPEASKLSYDVIVSDANIKSNCGINEKTAESWIKTGQSETGIPISPGDSVHRITRISIPEESPLCIVRYRIDTKLDGEDYATDFFDVKITS